MTIETVTVGGKQYNIAQASAMEQKKLLHLMAARLTYAVGKNTEVILDRSFLMGALMSVPEEDFDTVAKIVLYKTVVKGGDKVVDLSDFQGCVTSYYELVAEAVRVNLGDFIGWLNLARQPSEAPKATGG